MRRSFTHVTGREARALAGSEIRGRTVRGVRSTAAGEVGGRVARAGRAHALEAC